MDQDLKLAFEHLIGLVLSLNNDLNKNCSIFIWQHGDNIGDLYFLAQSVKNVDNIQTCVAFMDEHKQALFIFIKKRKYQVFSLVNSNKKKATQKSKKYFRQFTMFKKRIEKYYFGN